MYLELERQREEPKRNGAGSASRTLVYIPNSNKLWVEAALCNLLTFTNTGTLIRETWDMRQSFD